MAIYLVNQTYEGALRQYSFNGNLHDTSAAATADPTPTGTINFEQGGTNGYAYFNAGSGLTCPEFVSSGTTGGDFTISLWYFPVQASGQNNTVFYIGNLLLYFLSSNKIGGSHWNNYFTREGSNTYARNRWHHIVVVGSGTDLKYYVDGVLNYSRSNIGTPGIGGGTWYINTSPRTNDNPAAYDEFIVDNVAWSETQILSYYNATAPVHQLVDNPGVYWNPSQGLISASGDGASWITIADKNLGATKVYGTNGATQEEWVGNLYQRGNCYGFSCDSSVTPATSSTQVDVTNYGPSNYYSSSTFITSNQWFPTNTAVASDLWGDVTNTDAARQGPCPSGFHIMSGDDVGKLQSVYNSQGTYMTVSIEGVFKLPFGSRLYQRNSSNGQISSGGNYWITSNYYSSYNGSHIQAFYMTSSRFTVEPEYRNLATSNTNSLGTGWCIRPVKDTPVRPDASRTVLYQPSS